MQYIGIRTQQNRNSLRSAFLLFLFPCFTVTLLYLACYPLIFMGCKRDTEVEMMPIVNHFFLSSLPYIMGIVLIWFLITYQASTGIINSTTSSKPLNRQENKRAYNLVKNLYMSQDMKTPKINIIYDSSPNAFVSSINEHTYAVTLSEGITRKLNDEELEAVIAHGLGYIHNRDIRLLIISIVFVSIFSMLTEVTFYVITHIRICNNSKGSDGAVLFIFIALVIATTDYLFANLMRFAISREREYMADAGSAEITKSPLTLVNALHKISTDPAAETVKRKDVVQLLIQNPQKVSKSIFSGLSGLLATHPPIEKRVKALGQF